MDNVPETTDQTTHQTHRTVPTVLGRAGLMIAVAVLSAVILVAYGLLLGRQGDAQEAPVMLRACDGGEVEVSPEEARMVELHNEAREAAGKDYLCVSPALTEAAGGLAEDMIDKDYFDHTAPDGTTMENRLEQAGYDGYETAGENIAWGMGDTAAPENRFEALMNSEKHKQNILNDAYREFGVGYAAGTLKDKEDAGVYVTNFGSHGAEASHERPERVTKPPAEQTSGEQTIVGPAPGATTPEPVPEPMPETTAPERTDSIQQTQIIQESTDNGGSGGGSTGQTPPKGDLPDAQAMICEQFGQVREEVIGNLRQGGDDSGPASGIRGRIADNFQDDFLNPDYCDSGPDSGPKTTPEAR